MTMPRERMRSLRSGWELLKALQTDSSMPPALVARAAALAQSYPTPQTLIFLLQADRPQFPERFDDTIDSTRALFEKVQFGGNGSQETRRDALFTLRHFPLRGAADNAVSMALRSGLENWLAPEDSTP
jgi:hypothetical protein